MPFFWMWARNVIRFFIMKRAAIIVNNLNNFSVSFVQDSLVHTLNFLGFMSWKINWNLCYCGLKWQIIFLCLNQVLSLAATFLVTCLWQRKGFQTLTIFANIVVQVRSLLLIKPTWFVLNKAFLSFIITTSVEFTNKRNKF